MTLPVHAPAPATSAACASSRQSGRRWTRCRARGPAARRSPPRVKLDDQQAAGPARRGRTQIEHVLVYARAADARRDASSPAVVAACELEEARPPRGRRRAGTRRVVTGTRARTAMGAPRRYPWWRRVHGRTRRSPTSRPAARAASRPRSPRRRSAGRSRRPRRAVPCHGPMPPPPPSDASFSEASTTISRPSAMLSCGELGELAGLVLLDRGRRRVASWTAQRPPWRQTMMGSMRQALPGPCPRCTSPASSAVHGPVRSRTSRRPSASMPAPRPRRRPSGLGCPSSASRARSAAIRRAACSASRASSAASSSASVGLELVRRAAERRGDRAQLRGQLGGVDGDVEADPDDRPALLRAAPRRGRPRPCARRAARRWAT